MTRDVLVAIGWVGQLANVDFGVGVRLFPARLNRVVTDEREGAVGESEVSIKVVSASLCDLHGAICGEDGVDGSTVERVGLGEN